jgi:hypothetical protein
MATVQRWTGAETKALRQAMRLSVRVFAAHLGVDSRTVNKWEARGHTITLLPDTQALMDTALDQAPDDVKTRFIQGMDSAKQEQSTNQVQQMFGESAERLLGPPDPGFWRERTPVEVPAPVLPGEEPVEDLIVQQ